MNVANVQSRSRLFLFMGALGVAAMVHDRIVRGAVHPVLRWGGLVVILWQVAEVLSFDQPWWRALARSLWQVLGP